MEGSRWEHFKLYAIPAYSLREWRFYLLWCTLMTSHINVKQGIKSGRASRSVEFVLLAPLPHLLPCRG